MKEREREGLGVYTSLSFCSRSLNPKPFSGIWEDHHIQNVCATEHSGPTKRDLRVSEICSLVLKKLVRIFVFFFFWGGGQV